MNVENIVLSNTDFSYSEIIEDNTSLTAKFIICDFNPNENDVMLNRKTIDSWLHTLINQPVVGKIGVNDDGVCDFEGHNMQIVSRVAANGKVYKDVKFDTSAMGVFTDVSIEKIKGKEFIVATAKLWKRFPEFCAVVKRRLAEGILHTSWEIATKKSHFEMIRGRKVKVIDEGVFIGHALLNKRFAPAYKDSRVLEVASRNDMDLIDAISKDIASINSLKEDETLAKLNTTEPVEDVVVEASEQEDVTQQEDITPEVSEQDIEVNDETPEISEEIPESSEGNPEEETPETSALTEYDLRKALRKGIGEKLNVDMWSFDVIFHFPADKVVWVHEWNAESELDVIVFTYSVENDVVTISEPEYTKLTVSINKVNETIQAMQEKIDKSNTALIEAGKTITDLKSQVAELLPYKAEFEKAEQERIEAELAAKREALKAFALKGGYIKPEELENEFKDLIDRLDESAIKSVIAERIIESLGEVTPVETSTSSVETSQSDIKTNIVDNDDDDNTVDYRTIISNYLKKNSKKIIN